MGCTDETRITLGWDTKDPTDDAPYTIDWTAAIGTETITASLWDIMLVNAVGSSTMTRHDDIIITPGLQKTQTWVAGGSDGQDYAVINTVTTSASRILKRSFGVAVRCS